MQLSDTTFKAFGEGDLKAIINDRLSTMKSEIEGLSEAYILNVNEGEFTTYLAERFEIPTVILDFENVSASIFEREIPAEEFPDQLFVNHGQKYKMPVVKFHIPFGGNKYLLDCKPSIHLSWYPQVMISDESLCFEIVDFAGEPRYVKSKADEILNNLKSQFEYTFSEVEAYNNQLRSTALNLLRERKEVLHKRNEFVKDLGVKIKKRENIPQTFSIPTLNDRKRIVVKKPDVQIVGSYDPTLDETTYKEILRRINDVGKQFERMPSTQASKTEEAIRDHFLLMLEPWFEGSATGETFNKSGKTDILLRHEGNNAFIAECKFWKGEKGLLKTITQLLGYLTWRDSKSAVIIFVRNREFSSVLATLQRVVPSHQSYLRFVGHDDETWLNYKFHLNKDKLREVSLAVLAFHFPEN